MRINRRRFQKESDTESTKGINRWLMLVSALITAGLTFIIYSVLKLAAD